MKIERSHLKSKVGNHCSDERILSSSDLKWQYLNLDSEIAPHLLSAATGGDIRADGLRGQGGQL